MIKDTEKPQSMISYSYKRIIINKFLVSLEQDHNKKFKCRDTTLRFLKDSAINLDILAYILKIPHKYIYK